MLSWADIVSDEGMQGGYNVILHEFAHKLDMLNGSADGLPPLHKGMVLSEWTRVFQRSFDRLTTEAERGEETLLDPYGAESPAEFFAVASEAFFEMPDALTEFDPALYEQLKQFYRQDPLARMR
ncbi:MAG: zinc-dependent peptidase [Pseudomonadales bacterium]|nr:zinc-dependent peptidase [Pseudomonadales bacterium]